MRDGLESIRQVISRAIAVGDDGAEERMDARIDSIAPQPDRHRHRSWPKRCSRPDKQLEKISEQQALLSRPTKKSSCNTKCHVCWPILVKGQFHLMQEWLRPILTESIDNGRDLERLKQQLESMLENYQQVENAFESAQGKGNESCAEHCCSVVPTLSQPS